MNMIYWASSSDLITKKNFCSHFQYWTTVMELELCILIFVRSLHVASFEMYLDTLTELAPWFFALDHTNYAYWIPVHLKDMTKLPNFQIRRQPNVAKEFHDGNFVIRNTGECFLALQLIKCTNRIMLQ